MQYSEHTNGINTDLANKLSNLFVTPESIFSPELEVKSALIELLSYQKDFSISPLTALHRETQEALRVMTLAYKELNSLGHAVDVEKLCNVEVDSTMLGYLSTLGLYEEQNAQVNGNYSLSAIFGGHLRRFLDRLDHLVYQYTHLGVNVSSIALLGGKRKLADFYGENEAGFIEALSGASIPDKPFPKTEIEMMEWVFRYSNRVPDELRNSVKLIVADAKLREGHYRPSPGSEETSEALCNLNHEISGDILICSSQPYCRRQALAFASATYLSRGLDISSITTIGPSPFETKVDTYLLEIFKLIDQELVSRGFERPD